MGENIFLAVRILNSTALSHSPFLKGCPYGGGIIRHNQQQFSSTSMETMGEGGAEKENTPKGL